MIASRRLSLPALSWMLATAAGAPAQETAPEQDRSKVHRSHRSTEARSDRHGSEQPDSTGSGKAAVFPHEFRSIDGRRNNLRHPRWGAAEVPLRRTMPPDYADGLGAPAGSQRPSPREISNLVVAQSGSMPNPRRASDFLWQWGQFLDHDLDETPIADPAEPFDIPVPAGDPWFDPRGDGGVRIPLDRSGYELRRGRREQLNLITAYIDASNVYGSDERRARALRSLDGTGRLRTSEGDLLPYNVDGLPNAPDTSADFFLAGDVRANEQVALTAMHTLFVREHNHWADAVRRASPALSGDHVYEVARVAVAAEMQAITYREFLPLLLGAEALAPYQGYREDVDAGIANLFATAAYRVGHTMLSPWILRLQADGSSHGAGPLSLAQAFFNPEELVATGIDPILRGLAGQRAQDIDPFVIDEVRNLLFGPPGAGGFDLASLNIQRGRDHGLPSYNALRAELGLRRALRFEDVNPEEEIHRRLARAYDTVDDIDAWVGLLAEPRARGGLVGPALRRVLADQFERLRDGDRFWYESYLDPELVAYVNTQTLSVIIRRNTGVGSELPLNVFRVR